MSLYTPVFPPSLELRSTGPKELSSTEILRDIHLFLATKPEVLVPPSRPTSPSFDTNVESLKQSVLDAIGTARGDTGDRRWSLVNEKLKMGCVRGRYRLTGLNNPWQPPENAGWVLPDDEETWFKLEKERADARRLKGKTKRQSRYLDDASILRVPVSPKTMRKVTEKVVKWQATITTFKGASGDEKTVASIQGSTSKLGVKAKILAKDKNQLSSLGFPVVKRNVATANGKKGQSHFGLDPSGSKTPAIQERHAASLNREPEKAGLETPLRFSPGEGCPKIADLPETYIPPSFPSQLRTSTPQPQRDPPVSMRRKPSLIYPLCPSSSIPHPSTPGDGDRHPVEDPFIVDISSSLPMHSDGRQTNKRPLSPSCLRDVQSSTTRKRTKRSSAEEFMDHRSGLPTPSAYVAEIGNLTATRAESRLPHTANENPSPAKSYFSTPASVSSGSSVSARNLLMHSPVSPMLSFAQKPQEFIPQFTSTQAGGSRHKGMSCGMFGNGYSSQFDVEKHVGRVSELLEKDVDLDGWLRDVPAVEVGDSL